jgi:hypothetical protein
VPGIIPKETLYAGVVTDSISDRQRRAYLEVCAKKLANSRESDPDRERDLQIKRNRQYQSKLAELPSTSDQQVKGAEGGSREERKDATVQDRGSINK